MSWGLLAVIQRGMWLGLGLPALTGAGAFLLGVVAAWEGRELGASMGLLAVLLPLALVRLPERRAARRGLAEHGRKPPFGRHDALTGLASRAVVLDRLRILLSGDRQSDRLTALLLVDLIDFDGVNRDLGHAAGDLLLRHASARLLAGLREDDLLARLGGDQFAIVLGEVSRPADAATIADRLMRGFGEPFDLHGALWVASARVGVALAKAGSGHTPEQLLDEAGRAVARAKADGRGDVRFADAGVDADVREQRQLEGDLAGAFERGELELRYEPQVDLASRQMVGVGAALRWLHPTHGSIAPERLAAIVEDTPLNRPLGRWVLAQALARAAHWQRMGADLRVAVGLLPGQLADADLAETVATILTETGLAPDRLELEIAEAALMMPAGTHATLTRLRELGVRIGLDAFGGAQASLRHLCTLPLDAIKLDGDLVGRLDRDPTAQAIVRAALGLGRSLGLELAAKGVASANQLNLLDDRGCTLAQGPHFSPAVHPSEIEAIIESAKLPAMDEYASEESDLTA